MSSEFTMTFGDWAHTNKGLPGVINGSEVQIAGVGVHTGKLCYTAALYTSNGEFVSVIGPYPEHAFTFHSHCTTAEQHKLISVLSKIRSRID